MTVQIPRNTGLALTVLLSAVIFYWSLSSGLSNGKQMAQSRLVLKNVEATISGLAFFYGDQNRFPSVAEFQDFTVMSGYMNSYPQPVLGSEDCEEDFIYKRVSFTKYEMNFCLPTRLEGYKKGWNKEAINQEVQTAR